MRLLRSHPVWLCKYPTVLAFVDCLDLPRDKPDETEYERNVWKRGRKVAREEAVMARPGSIEVHRTTFVQ